MKRVNKDRLVNICLLLIGLVGLTFNIISNINKNKVNSEYEKPDKVNKEQFAMYIEDESGNYVEYESNVFPSYYILNTDNSKCVDINNNLVYGALSNVDNSVTVTANKTVFCYLYFDMPGFADYLLAEPARPSSLWTSTLDGDGHRFVGTSPSNYICFGTTDKDTCVGNTDLYMYRIIGIFQDSEGNNHLKLIKKEALNTNYHWNTDYQTDTEWNGSNIYIGLNGSYFLDNTAYSYMQDDDWKSKITDWNYTATNTKTYENSGLNYENNVTVSNIYLHEMNRSTKTSAVGGWTTVKAKIWLMYANDYALSLGNNVLSNFVYPIRDTLKTSWIHVVNNDNLASEYTMTRYGKASDETYSVWVIGTSGRLAAYGVKSTSVIARPVFYLESNVEYASGTGTASDPYIIYQELPTYTVTAIYSSGKGTVTPDSQVVVENGTAIFQFLPAEGYELVTTSCGGTISGNTVTIENVTSDMNCNFSFWAYE